MEAFEYAIDELGVDEMETDLWVSADKEIFIHHGQCTPKKSDGTGSIPFCDLMNLSLVQTHII